MDQHTRISGILKRFRPHPRTYYAYPVLPEHRNGDEIFDTLTRIVF